MRVFNFLISALVILFAFCFPQLGKCQCTIEVNPGMTWSVTGKDDLNRLKQLASGVGWEFNPNLETNERLRKIGIKSIRCINVSSSCGHFTSEGKFVVDKPAKLLENLKTCREIGAIPHIIIAESLPPELRITEQEVSKTQKELMGLNKKSEIFGPNNWGLFANFIDAFFNYILIEQKFPEAVFEVGNEPDGGGAINAKPPKPAPGSLATYNHYLNIYKVISQVAVEFEKKNAGTKIQLGGPAITWAFTFKYGDFNWTDRFLRDCKERNLKLDFIGLHYYGNISSFENEYESHFPSFIEMFRFTEDARDKYFPGVPIWFTEWGPSYHGNGRPDLALINSDHRGAAWTARFLTLMLETGVENAIYLCTADIARQAKDEKWENTWGWPSLFTNPKVFGKPYPHATFHVFDMISRLEGTRVEATLGNKAIRCFASADKNKKKITAILFNYDCRIPEKELPTDNSQDTGVILRIRGADSFFNSKRVSFRRWLVSEDTSNVVALLKGDSKPSDLCELQQVDSGAFKVLNNAAVIGFTVPHSSVSFVQIDVSE